MAPGLLLASPYQAKRRPLHTIPFSPPHAHIHFFFLVIGLLFSEMPVSLRIVAEGSWDTRCSAFSYFSSVLPKQGS